MIELVATGGFVGANLRFLAGGLLPEVVAVLSVNVVGSFVLGLAAFAGLGEFAMQFLGIGICGSFTTFSSFSVETVRVWEQGDRHLAVYSAAGNLLLSLGAMGLAWLLVSVLL